MFMAKDYLSIYEGIRQRKENLGRLIQEQKADIKRLEKQAAEVWNRLSFGEKMVVEYQLSKPKEPVPV